MSLKYVTIAMIFMHVMCIKTKQKEVPMIQVFLTRHITSECSNLLIVTINKRNYLENLHDNQLTQRMFNLQGF